LGKVTTDGGHIACCQHGRTLSLLKSATSTNASNPIAVPGSSSYTLGPYIEAEEAAEDLLLMTGNIEPWLLMDK
jgi:hypothetical protein